jgi:hypothetical protein
VVGFNKTRILLTLGLAIVALVNVPTRVPAAANGSDTAKGIAVDQAGNAYITGAYWNGATTVAFVAKFDPGCNLLCMGFVPPLAGGPDIGNAIALDGIEDVFVTGALTNPTGTTSAYVARFDSLCNWKCTGLVPSLAGGPDVGNGIVADQGGNTYLTGALTPVAGNTLAYVAQFDPSCNWQCTGFVPPLVAGLDVGNGIALDQASNAYITGALTPAAGTTTAFMAMFGPGCAWLCTSTVPTLVGGPDVGNGIALDGEARAFVTGALSIGSGVTIAYLARFDPPFCTYNCSVLLQGRDVGNGVAVNVDGVGYVTGAFTNGAATNAFVAMFFPDCDPNCMAPVPSVVGGPDSGNAIAMDSNGNGYLAGAMFNGAFTDAFVDKYDLSCNPLCPLPTILPNPN